MTEPGTDDGQLEQYAHSSGDGRWWFSDPHVTYTAAEALTIIAAWQSLGLVVSDVVSPLTFAALVQRVAV